MVDTDWSMGPMGPLSSWLLEHFDGTFWTSRTTHVHNHRLSIDHNLSTNTRPWAPGVSHRNRSGDGSHGPIESMGPVGAYLGPTKLIGAHVGLGLFSFNERFYKEMTISKIGRGKKQNATWYILWSPGARAHEPMACPCPSPQGRPRDARQGSYGPWPHGFHVISYVDLFLLRPILESSDLDRTTKGWPPHDKNHQSHSDRWP